MTNKKIMKKSTGKKLHPTGQLSIFAILIFQALFILFAMSLNIALVVHDKINLQNSVDLAAYYGAMKQAEMLNAIAHINYQIRQSWKLLTWRYRVLGNIGLSNVSSPGLSNIANQVDKEHVLQVYKPTSANPNKEGPYFVCLAHKYWGGFYGDTSDLVTSDTDMLCRDIDSTLPAVTVPKITGTVDTIIDTLTGVQDMSKKINTALENQCNFYGYNSWLFGTMAFFHFRTDQSARKFMIHELAKVMAGTSSSGFHEHGTDMDGQSIAIGVEKTFEKNLSYVNKDSFEEDKEQLKQFNSLEKASPSEWLEDQIFADQESYTGLYSNFTGSSGSCSKELDYLHHTHSTVNSDPASKALVERISLRDDWPSCSDTKACNPSAGLKKNKNFVIFYSVKAELDYKNQIFFPFNLNIKLSAKAYAKPFGGRIGPDASVDKLLPSDVPRSSSTSLSFTDFDKKHAPNYSRYPGDPFGLRSQIVHHHWAEHLKQAETERKNVCNYISKDKNDPLAWGSSNPDCSAPGTGDQSTARKWEIAAVAPDLFDVTYFTILPDYNYAYFPKIKNLLSNNLSYVRGDLGTFKDSTGAFKGSSILTQVGNVTDPNKNVWIDINNSGILTTKLIKPFYKITDMKLLLTGWNPPKKKYSPGDNDYETTSETNFAECSKWARDVSGVSGSSTKGQIANGCIYGGRTGYSVKMMYGFEQGNMVGGAPHPMPGW